MTQEDGNPPDPALEAGDSVPTIPIDDVHTLMQVLLNWHRGCKGRLVYMSSIPIGTTVTYKGKDHPLEGDLLLGFLIGLEVALIEIDKLPFAAELEPDRGTQH